MIGNLCVKLVGREGKRYCVIVDQIDSTHVLIDGNVKRRKCNINHLEVTGRKLSIKKGASTAEVHKAMEKEGIKTTKPKGKASGPKPSKKKVKKDKNAGSKSRPK
ncbi:50S ribosomal protein L14e [Candidatus Woesearchaeota archaeon]|nr:50S ribosomal protein L14e [Candidatus Woesearchaeota archaeon]